MLQVASPNKTLHAMLRQSSAGGCADPDMNQRSAISAMIFTAVELMSTPSRVLVFLPKLGKKGIFFNCSSKVTVQLV